MNTQSQSHGFTFENSVRVDAFDLPGESNNTDIHDIPKVKNKHDSNENCSIKATGSGTICCGDILRFYDYDFGEKNTILVIKYKQHDEVKVVETIYEIDYSRECHHHLFGNLPREVIEQYVTNVKRIPGKVKGADAKKIFSYLVEKKQINKNYTNLIQINPKVDGRQSRVQCSIPNFETALTPFIMYQSSSETPNLLRGKEIVAIVKSSRRKRKPRELKSPPC
jgi:hypothetical protein